MIYDIPLTEEDFCSVGKPKLAPKWPKVGDKVRFKGADGFHYPNFVNIIKFAKDNLKVGEIYTVRNCEVYSSWCAIQLEGKGLSDAIFHLSMFEWPLKELT